ncbi:hypothetical protein QQY66_01390 [Streptomyces sp. DG2A-72]|uniref:hypothetical protein n=1 Tax=Streptomyces sp. DG2A-72 TaxID=3051386 RepID=UPI00265C643E|nr:hypothetical protein [Streptomyces sp. DG2A-72]MDO0930415.1 hypothetical protein [Streptomyces sp. DG2A-72]
MRQEWSPEELLASWTLVERDWKLVANKTGATRLGFCLMCCRWPSTSGTTWSCTTRVPVPTPSSAWRP